ncbi:MAG: hypothetical protein QME81_06490 [bacterium]|nr:hypothetical protein [bacterium]
MRQRIASEMLRVLKPDGILWYDFHMDNPKNTDVKGVKKKEVKQLFPNRAPLIFDELPLPHPLPAS